MRRLAPAAAVLVASLALAGCGGPSASDPVTPAETAAPDTPAPAPEIEVRKDIGAYITTYMYKGTELICLVRGGYGSTTCNWELWNKMQESK